ncbi:hypothetical protein NAC44_17680 [Allorhizobium sp. BGMRC 0089]|uniref:hypothetical protein n=1 Tax=Allorhizobium sonneratiae TaxID=2934936 RepID=UPI00203408DD|nr:hypothetical protein [Allorhizobium sonneratiae]MCM2294160.1 hypothetical protein [Allorhizobium sonneratiae]
MAIKWLVSAGLALACATGSLTMAHADDAPQFAKVKGRCLRLTIGEQDMTEICNPDLGRSLHGDGRSGLYFFLGKDHIVTFSGRPVANDANDASEIEKLKLDEIILNPGASNGKTQLQTIGASGYCKTHQTGDETYLVICSGKLQKGTPFKANFEIDKTMQ